MKEITLDIKRSEIHITQNFLCWDFLKVTPVSSSLLLSFLGFLKALDSNQLWQGLISQAMLICLFLLYFQSSHVIKTFPCSGHHVWSHYSPSHLSKRVRRVRWLFFFRKWLQMTWTVWHMSAMRQPAKANLHICQSRDNYQAKLFPKLKKMTASEKWPWALHCSGMGKYNKLK